MTVFLTKQRQNFGLSGTVRREDRGVGRRRERRVRPNTLKLMMKGGYIVEWLNRFA